MVITFDHEIVDEILKSDFLTKALFVLYKVVRTFECADEILMCDHSNESYLTVLC